MRRLSGKQIILEMLIAEGVQYIFGNPGTRELPFMDALSDYPQLKYILALQETTAVGMADGYARASGKPAFVNLHITVGLANGLSLIYNAFRGGTPMVITAGQADTRSLIQEANLTSNMADICRHFTKWSTQPYHAGELPMVLRRAFKVAKMPPTGPTFVALPFNVMDQVAEVDISPSAQGYFAIRPDEKALTRAVDMLSRTQRPVMVVGDRIAQCGAMQEVVRVAELIGAQVYGSTFSEVCFPTSHPQYMGLLNVVDPAAARAILDPADVVLAVGMDVFNQSWYAEPLLDARNKLIHMDNALWEVEKNYPIAVGVWCDLKTGLEEFYAALEEVVSGSMQEQAKTRARQMGEKKAQRKQAFLQRAEQVWDGEPIALERVAMELKGMMPKNAIFVDDAVSARGVFLSAMDFDEPSGYIAQRGGSIGWGLPAALGVKLGRLSRPVVAVVGDGSAMCSIQAFWNAAHDNLPVTWVILNNGSYRVLKENMKTYFNLVLGQKDRKSKYIGMDFASPPLDFVSLANGQGVWGIKVTKASELRPALEKALGLGKPAVVDVVVEAGSF